jgi:hypothetical protein
VGRFTIKAAIFLLFHRSGSTIRQKAFFTIAYFFTLHRHHLLTLNLALQPAFIESDDQLTNNLAEIMPQFRSTLIK